MIPDHIASLKGKDLKDRAAELDITGRSKMNTQELREAILEAEVALTTSEENESQETVTRQPSMLDTILARLHEAKLWRSMSGVESAKNATSTLPMDNARRKAAYQASNGTSKLTVAQARRLRKKSHKDV